jgi:YVTN family beta-propeller protein
MWVANSLSNTISRIDPDSLTVTATIEVGEGPAAVTVGGGAVWVANFTSGTITRVSTG